MNNKYIPEYKKLGVQPIQLPQQKNVPQPAYQSRNVSPQQQIPKRIGLSANKPYQPTIQIEPSINDLENQAHQINETQFDGQNEFSKLDFPTVNDYSYVLVYENNTIGVFDSKADLETYLDEICFKGQTEINADFLQIFKKIPLKIGVCALE